MFKKVSELVIFCNVELGIVVFLLGGKFYFYGKLNFDVVIEWFMRECDDDFDSGDDEEEEEERGKSRFKMKKVNECFDCFKREIEVEKK